MKFQLSYFKSSKMMLSKCCTQYASKLENSAVTTGPENVSFHSNPKEGNAKECSNYCTFALISHTSKVMLKILQVRLEQYVNRELLDTRAGFRKTEKPEVKLPTSTGSYKKQENSRKTSTWLITALLIMPKSFDFIYHNKLWKIQEMGIPNHFNCLLSNPYAAQEATVRTGPRTTDWFQIWKGVHQGCMLSPCLFNLYTGCLCVYVFICSVVPDSCDPIDCILPGSAVHGILQARMLEWVAISCYTSSWPRNWTWVSWIAGGLFTDWATKDAGYIMWNARLDEAQAGIKIAGRNINNFRYADDTTLMAESEEDWRASWWKWKRILKKLAWNSTFKKLRSWHMVPSLHGK